MSVFQLHGIGIATSYVQWKSASPSHGASHGHLLEEVVERLGLRGRGSRTRAAPTRRPAPRSGPARRSRSVPKPRREGTSRSSPSRFQHHRWYPQRSSVRPAALTAREDVAPVAAHVLEGPQRALVGAKHDDRQPARPGTRTSRRARRRGRRCPRSARCGATGGRAPARPTPATCTGPRAPGTAASTRGTLTIVWPRSDVSAESTATTVQRRRSPSRGRWRTAGPDRPAVAERIGQNPRHDRFAFADILAANRDYAADFRLAGLRPEAARGLAVLTCIDSRIEPLDAARPRPWRRQDPPQRRRPRSPTTRSARSSSRSISSTSTASRSSRTRAAR